MPRVQISVFIALHGIIVKPCDTCTKKLIKYVPFSPNLLKQLPWQLHQVAGKVPLLTSRRLVLIEKRGVFRTSLVRLLSQSERIISTWAASALLKMRIFEINAISLFMFLTKGHSKRIYVNYMHLQSNITLLLDFVLMFNKFKEFSFMIKKKETLIT